MRVRRFVLLAVLLLIAHFSLTVYAIHRMSDALDGDVQGRFAPSFAVALCTLPLSRPIAVNSLLVAVAVAFALTWLPKREIAIVAAATVLLIFGGMWGGALWLERRAQRGWRELAPHAIELAPPGDLATSLGAQPVDAISKYLAAEIARGDDEVDQPPQEVRWFLIAHRAEIDALRARRPSTRDPLELFRLQKILLVDALQSRSWDGVAAARRITEAMPPLYAIAATENQLGVVRKLATSPTSLPPYSVPFDPHRRLVDDIAAQAAKLRAIAPPWYAQPYARLCLAESADSALRQARRIASVDRCDFDTARERQSRPRVPFNPTGVLDGGASDALRANRLLLDLEGTERILSIKRGEPPRAASRCAGRQWILDGGVLRLQPPLPAAAPFLPSRHRIAGHD
jgi:hypothetical protein